MFEEDVNNELMQYLCTQKQTQHVGEKTCATRERIDGMAFTEKQRDREAVRVYHLHSAIF